MLRRALLSVLLVGVVAIIAGPTPAFSASPPAAKSVVLFAAASTGHVLDEIKVSFKKAYGIDVKTSYAGTSTLAQQVVNGAEAEVFLSANTKWADFLEQKGLVVERLNLLGNRLVVVVPADSRFAITKPEDLLSEQVRHIALADPEGVPAGVYAKKALVALGLWDRLRGKVAAADHVQHALSFVETGAAEAGFVYSTDAAASKEVKVALKIDEKLTGPIRYPLLLLKAGAGNPAAVSLFRYLGSPEAIEVFQKHGFEAIGKPKPGRR